MDNDDEIIWPPPIPKVYRDHRKFIYQLTVSKTLTHSDKNKEGEIIEIDRKNFRAKVKGLNMIKKHVKTTKEKKGGIFEKENFLNLSNLSIISTGKKGIKKKEAKKWYLD